MSDLTASDLDDAAHLVRKLIDAADRSAWGVQFEYFPKGTCGAVSEMFGKYLIDYQGIDADYVSGHSTSGKSHAWIEYLGMIIDLTGDQFDGNPLPLPPVFVSYDHQWHMDNWSDDQQRTSVSKIFQYGWASRAAYQDLTILLRAHGEAAPAPISTHPAAPAAAATRSWRPR